MPRAKHIHGPDFSYLIADETYVYKLDAPVLINTKASAFAAMFFPIAPSETFTFVPSEEGSAFGNLFADYVVVSIVGDSAAVFAFNGVDGLAVINEVDYDTLNPDEVVRALGYEVVS